MTILVVLKVYARSTQGLVVYIIIDRLNIVYRVSSKRGSRYN